MVTVLALGVMAVGANDAQAGVLSITVTTTTDDQGANTSGNVGNCATTDTSCTLRQAINTIDISGNAGSTITVPAGTYTIAVGHQLPQIFNAVTINGGANASTIIDGGGAGPPDAFEINGPATPITININNLTIQNFKNSQNAFGVVVVQLQNAGSILNWSNSVIKNNEMPSGAGFEIGGTGTVNINNTEIKGNIGDSTLPPLGGHIDMTGSANVVVTNSAIVGNSGAGSTVCIGCRSAVTGTTYTFTNDTISGNLPTTQPVINDAKGSTVFSYNTFSNNTPGAGAAVISRSTTTGDTFKGNIVSGNTGTNCAFTTNAPTVSPGFNYDSGTTCQFGSANGNHSSTAVTLGMLQNNGGPTDTMALPAGSPAIDTGGTGGSCTSAASGNPTLTADQRGTPRPQGAQCDPGSYEALAGPTCQGLTKSTGADQPLPIALSCAGTGTLTYGIVGNPTHGSLTNFNSSTGNVTYTPSSGYFGPDSFTYNATNAGGTSSTVTVSITVNPPPPSCHAVQSNTKIGVPVDIQLNCSDAAGAALTYAIDNPPSHGGLGTVNQSTGVVTYTPTAGFSGNDSFTYHATSADGTTSATLVTIFVSESGGPPGAPTCQGVTSSTGTGAPVTIHLSCSDQGGAELSYAIDANPVHGALSDLNQSSAAVTYTPSAGFSGLDTFTYHATSVNGSAQPATVSITVGSGGGAPNTKIGKAKIDQKNNSATFAFKAVGGSKAKATSGFQCALLKKKHAKPRFKKCKSPKKYKHLKPGKYTFEVRAFNSAGKDKTPAKKKFKIKP